MTLRGHVQNGVIVLDPPASLPGGTPVHVEPVESHADVACFRNLPPAKAPDAAEKEALRALLTSEQFEALLDIAAAGGPDIETIARIRGKSMT
jgi:hypothetical protein